jgi:hypothetical protein
MSQYSTRQPSMPTTITDILQFVADARQSSLSDEEEPKEVSGFIDFVSAFKERVEQSANFAALEAVTDALDMVELTAAHQALFPLWSDLHVPRSLEWTPTGSSLSAIAPPILRSGRYHDVCLLPDNGGFLMRAICWKYLATQLAMRRASATKRHSLVHVHETENVLVNAAKTQRRILNGMLISEEQLAGDLTALAITAEDNDHFDSFLVTVSELSHVVRDGVRLVSRAQQALSKINKCDVHHCILMADSINNKSMQDSAYYSCGQQIHLVGNPDEVRFIIFVSDVPDHDVVSTESYEGLFQLDRSRLRDLFISNSHNDKKYIDALTLWARTIDTPSSKFEPDALFQFLTYGPAHNEAETEDSHDEIISREQIARKFFGYRSPDFDL